jgi:hypothetical protein
MSAIESDLDLAANAVSGIIGSVESAAKLMAELCRRHAGFISELHKRLKMQVSVAYLRRLERCGNGELHPALCLCVGPGQPFIEKLSRADQERVVNGVAWPDGDTHRIRPLSELDYHEAKAAFFGGAVADPETITRRIKAHEAQKRKVLDQYEQNRAEQIAEREAAIREIESHGIKCERGMITIPKNTKIKADQFAEWLYANGY